MSIKIHIFKRQSGVSQIELILVLSAAIGALSTFFGAIVPRFTQLSSETEIYTALEGLAHSQIPIAKLDHSGSAVTEDPAIIQDSVDQLSNALEQITPSGDRFCVTAVQVNADPTVCGTLDILSSTSGAACEAYQNDIPAKIADTILSANDDRCEQRFMIAAFPARNPDLFVTDVVNLGKVVAD